jgi:hypothetical protein
MVSMGIASSSSREITARERLGGLRNPSMDLVIGVGNSIRWTRRLHPMELPTPIMDIPAPISPSMGFCEKHPMFIFESADLFARGGNVSG